MRLLVHQGEGLPQRRSLEGHPITTSRNRLSCEVAAKGGIRISVALKVSADDPGSVFHLTADLRGGVLSGPVGKLVARVLRSDVRTSIENLAALQ